MEKIEAAKGLESLIEATTKGLREKTDFPGRWCKHFTEECVDKMRQYGETGVLCEHRCEYCTTFMFAVDRAKHYSEKTGLAYLDILKSWESNRKYWYLNYYQDCKQPKIKTGKVRIFETMKDYQDSLGENGFRCPKCGAETSSPYECSCNWKSYGLLGTMGKGITVFVKENMAMGEIFMPVAWEKDFDCVAEVNDE